MINPWKLLRFMFRDFFLWCHIDLGFFYTLNLGFWGLKFGVDYSKNLTSNPPKKALFGPLKIMVQTFFQSPP